MGLRLSRIEAGKDAQNQGWGTLEVEERKNGRLRI